MPYHHDLTDSVPTTDIPIWRYMDFARFLDLIRSNALYFRCVEEFKELDPFEGAFPTNHVTGLLPDWRSQGALEHHLSILTDQIVAMCDVVRKLVYVNCWHVNEYESAAMWSQYGPTDGIAIKTNIERMKASFATDHRNVRISEIRYIDYDKQDSDYRRIYLYKRKSFEHEKELRAFVDNDRLFMKLASQVLNLKPPSPALLDVVNDHTVKYETGVKVNACAMTLIEEVRIAPRAQPFVEDVLRDVMAKYGLGNKLLRQSTIREMPR